MNICTCAQCSPCCSAMPGHGITQRGKTRSNSDQTVPPKHRVHFGMGCGAVQRIDHLMGPAVGKDKVKGAANGTRSSQPPPCSHGSHWPWQPPINHAHLATRPQYINIPRLPLPSHLNLPYQELASCLRSAGMLIPGACCCPSFAKAGSPWSHSSHPI